MRDLICCQLTVSILESGYPRKMTSGEGSLWLRECLAAKDIEVLDDVVLPTTHSCKATLLLVG